MSVYFGVSVCVYAGERDIKERTFIRIYHHRHHHPFVAFIHTSICHGYQFRSQFTWRRVNAAKIETQHERECLKLAKLVCYESIHFGRTNCFVEMKDNNLCMWSWRRWTNASNGLSRENGESGGGWWAPSRCRLSVAQIGIAWGVTK